MVSRATHTGKFFPKNPDKYVGDANNIIFRSSWELKLMKFLDETPNVLKWGSEEISIDYYDPVAQRPRRYFPDMVVILKKADNIQEKVMIEIKPFQETIEPTPKKTKTGQPTKQFLYESFTYQTNTAKWDAAKDFCNKHNMKFLIFTEYELGLKRR